MSKQATVQLSYEELANVWKVFHEIFSDTDLPPIYIFGSRSNNTAFDTSDLDLLIKDSEKLPLETYYALKDAFEYSDLPFRVDLLDWHRLSKDFQNTLSPHLQALPFAKQEM